MCFTNYFETICKIYLYFHRLQVKTTRIGRLLDELQTVEGFTGKILDRIYHLHYIDYTGGTTITTNFNSNLL